ncbi:hypothetical protein M0802_012572 [Mischocyttarus mexicanus]|nr:hypothetical protein M0802_012572 [Mischocyttarus mexicanus]
MRFEGFTSFNTALMSLIKIDKQLKEDEIRNVSPTYRNRVANIRQIKEVEKCNYCHKPGHKENECYSKITCNYCQRKGHPEASFCKKTGHVIFQCLTLKYKKGSDGGRSPLPNTQTAPEEPKSESRTVQVKHIKLNKLWTAPCVNATSPRLRDAVTLMIDTGADINLIKEKELKRKTIINKKDIIQITGQSHLLAYITSWMSSELWAGTVNFRISSFSRLDENNNLSLDNCYITSVNSVYIPGPMRVAIVLVDETSDNVGDQITIRGQDIPVWRGRRAVNPVNIVDMLAQFWSTNNIAQASRDLLMAHEEICNKLGVENSCGMAASLAAEIEAPGGSWTYDGSRLDKVGRMLSTKFTLDEERKEQARRRTVGYNFSALTPNHLAPTGIVKSNYNLADIWLQVTWGSLAPLYSTPSKCTCCPLPFPSVVQHFWGSTISAQGSGLDLTTGVVVHHDIRDIADSWPKWDEDLLSEYFGINPYDNIDWLTSSPVPYQQTLQWIMKMGITKGVANHRLATFRHLGEEHNALEIKPDQMCHKMCASSTIDIYRYFPQLVCRETDELYRYVRHWFDNVSYYSSALVNKTTTHDTSYYASFTPCLQNSTIGLSYNSPALWYSINSKYVSFDEEYFLTRVSSINWPDPPLIDTIWNGAKNYLFKPAVSALGGLPQGGPLGTIAASVGQIASQLATDVGASGTAQEIIDGVEGTARRVLGMSPTQERDITPTIQDQTITPGSQSVPQGHEDSANSITCGWPLYLYYHAVSSTGQVNVAKDIISVCSRLAELVSGLEGGLRSDACRRALKGLSSWSFPLVFSSGPAYMFFAHLHALTGKSPYTSKQIMDDITK